jgi:DNA-binding response OmpR family regulator
LETGPGSNNVAAQVLGGHQVDNRPVLPSLGLEDASRGELVQAAPLAGLRPPMPANTCRWGAQVVQLTRGSAVLLQELHLAHPQGVRREHLARRLVQFSGRAAATLSPAGKLRRVDTQVSRLRTELVAGGLEALKIESVRSMGYRLALPE